MNGGRCARRFGCRWWRRRTYSVRGVEPAADRDARGVDLATRYPADLPHGVPSVRCRDCASTDKLMMSTTRAVHVRCSPGEVRLTTVPSRKPTDSAALVLDGSTALHGDPHGSGPPGKCVLRRLVRRATRRVDWPPRWPHSNRGCAPELRHAQPGRPTGGHPRAAIRGRGVIREVERDAHVGVADALPAALRKVLPRIDKTDAAQHAARCPCGRFRAFGLPGSAEPVSA